MNFCKWLRGEQRKSHEEDRGGGKKGWRGPGRPKRGCRLVWRHQWSLVSIWSTDEGKKWEGLVRCDHLKASVDVGKAVYWEEVLGDHSGSRNPLGDEKAEVVWTAFSKNLTTERTRAMTRVNHLRNGWWFNTSLKIGRVHSLKAYGDGTGTAGSVKKEVRRDGFAFWVQPTSFALLCRVPQTRGTWDSHETLWD